MADLPKRLVTNAIKVQALPVRGMDNTLKGPGTDVPAGETWTILENRENVCLVKLSNASLYAWLPKHILQWKVV